MKRINPDDLITVSTAMRLKNCTKQAIWYYINHDLVRTIHIDTKLFLYKSEILDLDMKKVPPKDVVKKKKKP